MGYPPKGALRLIPLIGALLSLLAIAWTQVPAEAAHHGGKSLERRYYMYLVRVAKPEPESASVGSMVLHVYHVLNRKYPYDRFVDGMVASRLGEIVDVWVEDVDPDDFFEILIWTRCLGSSAAGELVRYQCNGERLEREPLPNPREELLKGYRGGDVYWLQDRTILRMFPTYTSGDSMAEPHGSPRVLRYDPNRGMWLDCSSQSLFPWLRCPYKLSDE
jgi:hypothetical protein